MYALAGSPTSTHVFREAVKTAQFGVTMIFTEGRACPGYRLLGDLGCINSVSAVAPYQTRAAQEDAKKQRCSDQHAGCCRVVEQNFGILNKRFPILYSICRIKPPNVQLIIQVCVPLYNISIELGAQKRLPLGEYRVATIPFPDGFDDV